MWGTDRDVAESVIRNRRPSEWCVGLVSDINLGTFTVPVAREIIEGNPFVAILPSSELLRRISHVAGR